MIRFLMGAIALASIVAFTANVRAAAADYRFELVGKPRLLAGKDIVQVQLVRITDGKPVPDVVIFESNADMGPAGMATMTAPVKALPVKDGIASFEINPAMAGIWALHLAAKVQGEIETVRGTVNVDLVK